MGQSEWQAVLGDRRLFIEAMIHLEARAMIKAVGRVARSSWGRDARTVVLGDNLAAILAFARSRARRRAQRESQQQP